MSKCQPKYKNLNEIQSFSEQRYITVQWAEQNCQNDEYLKQQIDLLNYQSNPTVRKRFCPILLDDVKSWGCQVNPNNTVTFSSKTEEEIFIDFSDMTYIDENNSDCAFETYLHSDQTFHKRACVPEETTSTVNYNCRNHTGGGLNSYWYVGYDKAKTYQTRPEWVKNWKDPTIPSVARAQTFTIPSGITNGKLESVDLKIETMGSVWSAWGSPLYVQVWKTKQVKVEKTYWDRPSKSSKSYNPKQYETIYFPDGNPSKALATASFQPGKITPSWQNFRFDKEITVNSGEHYALVFLSPLSHPDHCPRIGGWGRNCAIDKYTGGDAFLSENNGRTWSRYGKNAATTRKALKKIQYKMGRYTPLDFAFQCHIREYENGRDTEEEYYLYLNPIQSNPIKKIEINYTGEGDEESSTQFLIFEVSSDGVNWRALNDDYTVHFNPDSTGEYPHIVFVRARMKSNLTSGQTTTTVTPYIEKMKITLEMDAPKELYARTCVYNPKITPMLGASVWGRVFAPFTEEPTVTGSVEVIQNHEVSESFEIITAENLEDYVYTDDEDNLVCVYDGIDAEAITNESIHERYMYLINNPNAISIFKQNNVYIKPYTYTTLDEETVTEMLSFEDGVKLLNSPAYPILEAKIEPSATDAPTENFKEWVDFKFDYDNDILNFFYEEDHYVIDRIPTGSFVVSYNPIFIQDLSSTEVGRRSSDDEGLILDYFKETIIISDTELESRRVPLRCAAVDPLKEVLLNEEEIFEDVDFTVDYTTNELVFPIVDVDNTSTILNNNDALQIVYTPNIEDTGISIGYRAKRENKDKEIIIEPNYIEYKV